MSSVIFNAIRYKNFLSTGNVFTEISLNEAKNTLIVGDNGSGKSTFMDAICFALFNKPFRNLNKPKLINSVTRKELLVEIDLMINGIEYTIRRGMKPNIFDIYKNGVLVNQSADNRDYQDMLEKQILRMNYKTFCQVIILGSASFAPFMQLPAWHRREVVESLLDLQVFTTMNLLLKNRLSSNEDIIRSLQHSIEIKSKMISVQEEHIRAIMADGEEQIEEKNQRIQEIETEISSKMIESSKIMDKIGTRQTTTKDANSIAKKLKELESIKHKLCEKIARHKNDVKFFQDNENCPTCMQIIDEGFRCDVVKDKNSKISEFEEALNTLSTEYEKLNSKLEKINEAQKEINDLNSDVRVIQSRIQMLNKRITELRQEIKRISINLEARTDEVAVEKIREELNDVKAKLSEALSEKRAISVLSSMLKDTGIKSKIISQYVPIINGLINKYLSAMDFFIDFNLDENFEEKIGSRFRDDFSYESFSEGEKLRIDLAIMFAWRAISKMRNSVSSNLLIMDEIMDSSLDDSGVEEFLKILTSVTGNDNVFIISHRSENIIDKFDRIITFKKVNNFSKVQE